MPLATPNPIPHLRDMGEGKDGTDWTTTLTQPENHLRLAAVIILGTFYLVLTLWLGVHLIDALKAGIAGDDEKYEGIRNLGLLLVAALGAPFVLYRTLVLGKQARIADTQAQLAEDRNFSDLFTKAVEQLGADKVVKTHAKAKSGDLAYDENGVPVMQEITAPKIEVRLGAIYALQRISRASPKDHIPIMETLCAYIRENAAEGDPEEFPGEDLPDKDDTPLGEYLTRIEARTRELRKFWRRAEPLHSDIRAAITVIGDRSAERRTVEETQNYRLNLRRANLQRADLVGVDFTKADLREARLEGANLSNAKIDGANLFNAKMVGAYLINAGMDGANLNYAKMDAANLGDAKMDGADLNEAKLGGAYLIGAKMDGANLSSAKMNGANLNHAQMERANLFNAKMEGANLFNAKMDGANLSDAKMDGATLSSARFKSAKLTACNMDSVNASFADFTQAEGLTPEALDRFFGCAETKLPDGLLPPDHWHPTGLTDSEESETTYQTWLADRKANTLPPFDKARA